MASRLDFSKFQEDVESVVSGSTSGKRMPVEPEVVAKPTQRPRITPAMVDEAVNKVMASVDFPEEVKNVMRSLLASDPNAGFASSYYYDRSEARRYNAHPSLERKTVNITLVHSAEETAELAAYAPEFDIRFTEEDSQDHALVASMRNLDHRLLLAKVPRGAALKDIGGNPIFHIRSGTPNVHVCDPNMDRKDPSRGTTRRMQAASVRRSNKFPPVSVEMAERYLMGDETFVCGRLAQECRFQSRITMSCHVYDVRMEDWPRIMKAAGATMHVGCLIFPTEAFSRTSGTLKRSRTRYEVDVEKNVIHMGFEGAASWWYSHNWLDFMRYGSDQLIDYEGERFSYKITERRGDTVFFQILRVASGVSLGKQWYRVPGVKMVRVHGFDLTAKPVNTVVGRAPIEPREHWFPAALWEDMLRQACLDFERGAMTYEKLFNYYRTVSPRNTINGVLISGGQRVAHDEMVALVVHVGMAAATTVMLAQRTSRMLTETEMRMRIRATESRFSRMVDAFLGTVKAAADIVTYYPLRWLVDKIVGASEDVLANSLISWAYEPDVVEVPFSQVVGSSLMKKYVSWSFYDERAEDTMVQHYSVNASADHARALERAPACAALIREICADGLSDVELDKLRKATSSVGSSTAVNTENPGAAVGEPRAPRPDESTQVTRRNAILECIQESALEEQALDNQCEKIYRRCTDATGKPVEEIIRRRAEEYFQPDFWPVRNGVLAASVLGVEPAECRFTAGFSLVKDQWGTRFRTLLDEQFEPADGSPVKEYKVVADRGFSGYLMTIDRLVVFNGPEVRETLGQAVHLPHNYTVVLEQGPPGCGKTYSLLQAMQQEDAAMCPVRESAMDTRTRLGQQQPGFFELKLRVRTVDSYLVNYSVESTQELRASVLRADEAFMTHAGKWYAAAALLGVKEIYAYGDKKQIPHIPRVQAPKHYLRLIADAEVENFITRRCPADAVAAWGGVYDWRVRTVSEVRTSISVHKSHAGLTIPEGCVMMCMYQADKKEIRRMFASVMKSKKLRVMSTHESEGKTFKCVWLFRFDSRERSDNTSLFDQEPHCLVAMSRHTDQFRYIRPRDINDQVDKWIKSAQDVRRITAALDVQSRGRTVEFA